MAQQQQQQQPTSQTPPKHQHYADQTEQGLTGSSSTEVEVVQLNSNSASMVPCDPTNPTTTTTSPIIHYPNTATMSRLQESTTNSGAKSTSSSGHRLLRRAFTLPRNPFQRLSSRKFLKVNGGVASGANDSEESNGTYVRTNGTIESPFLISQNGGTLGRGNAWQTTTDENEERPQSALQGSGERRTRGSWKKIFGRLAQQVTNVGVCKSCLDISFLLTMFLHF